MINYRIHTFLKLCELLNYRKTAEALSMTQPAVTQHIQYLESYYQVQLFQYSGKSLMLTKDGERLKSYARSVVYNESVFQKEMQNPKLTKLSIGATKTIGDYVANTLILDLLKDESIQLNLIINNTEYLFQQLHNFALDLLMIEGYFDKNHYDYRLIRKEELIGICSPKHRFANQTISFSELFCEHLILREAGSGSRNVLEHFLMESNHSIDSFKRYSSLGSIDLIQEAVLKEIGISFVYKAIPDKNKNLATFRLIDDKIFHELNYVVLKNSKALNFIKS